MATYRIYYLERTTAEPVTPSAEFWTTTYHRVDFSGESEWEETYDGKNATEALDGFFRDHAGDKENVRLVEEDGSARELGGYEEYDADRTYVWIEEGKLMEYQGLDEATEGMVSCPLCDGTGEVDEETAADFAETFKHE